MLLAWQSGVFPVITNVRDSGRVHGMPGSWVRSSFRISWPAKPLAALEAKP